MKTLIDHYIAYDLWANSRFVNRLEQLPEEILDRDAPSSFPTLRKTLLHIRDAEHAWWCRLTETPMAWPAEANDDVATLMKYSEQFHLLVLSMDEQALVSEHSYKDLRGNTHRQKVWQMIMHCLNHSTQHRGQLITQLRFLGVSDIPAADLVVYQRSLAN